jgi:hypothetical protein
MKHIWVDYDKEADVQRWTFDLPAMPLGSLGRMALCLGPVTMTIPPSFVMHGRRVFDVYLSKQS